MTTTDGIKKKSISVPWLAVLLFIVALGVMACCYYNIILYKRNLEKQYRIQETRITIATNEITKLQKNFEALNSKLGHLSPSKNSDTLFQINELIGLANQGLIIYNDIAMALRILNYSKKMLKEKHDPFFTELQYAMSADITRLSVLPQIDKIMLSGQLDGLSSVVANLQMTVVVKPVKNAANNSSIWVRLIYNIQNRLSSLVRLSKLSGVDNEVLLPQQLSVVKESVLVDCLSAKIALLQHNQTSWNYNLNNAKITVVKYLSAYANADKVIAQLNSLSNINLDNSHTNIDATLAQLSKLNSLNDNEL